MKRSFLPDTRYAGVFAVAACLFLLSACATERDGQLLAEERVAELVKNLLRDYEQEHTSFPRTEGKLFFTWLHSAGESRDIEFLKCPGLGAKDGSLTDWPKNTINYWDAAGDAGEDGRRRLKGGLFLDRFGIPRIRGCNNPSRRRRTFFIGFAEGRAREQNRDWSNSKFPFAGLRGR